MTKVSSLQKSEAGQFLFWPWNITNARAWSTASQKREELLLSKEKRAVHGTTFIGLSLIALFPEKWCDRFLLVCQKERHAGIMSMIAWGSPACQAALLYAVFIQAFNIYSCPKQETLIYLLWSWAIFTVSFWSSNIMRIFIIWSFSSFSLFNAGSWDCRYYSYFGYHTSAMQHQLSVCMLFPLHFAVNERPHFFFADRRYLALLCIYCRYKHLTWLLTQSTATSDLLATSSFGLPCHRVNGSVS